VRLTFFFSLASGDRVEPSAVGVAGSTLSRDVCLVSHLLVFVHLGKNRKKTRTRGLSQKKQLQNEKNPSLKLNCANAFRRLVAHRRSEINDAQSKAQLRARSQRRLNSELNF
jgi:hypothetical protein